MSGDNKADAVSKLLPIQAHHLKKGHYVMMKGRPAKVTSVSVSKTGKHGHAKITYQGVDIINQKKYSEVQPGHANCLEPVVEKKEYSLIDVEEKEGTVACMDKEFNSHTLDCDFKSEVGAEILTRFKGGEELIIGTLTAPVGEGATAELVEVIETVKSEKGSKAQAAQS